MAENDASPKSSSQRIDSRKGCHRPAEVGVGSEYLQCPDVGTSEPWHRENCDHSMGVAVERSTYLAFRFFSSLAAFFSFMVLAGFFLSLFFESIPLLISSPPSWLWPVGPPFELFVRKSLVLTFAWQPTSGSLRFPLRPIECWSRHGLEADMVITVSFAF